MGGTMVVVRNLWSADPERPLDARGRPGLLTRSVLLLGTVAAVAGLLTGCSAALSRSSATTSTVNKSTSSLSAHAAIRTAPTPCGKATAGWPVSRLLAQLLMLTGNWTAFETLAQAATSGVGGLEMAFAPGVEPETKPATRVRVQDADASLVSDATHAGQVAPIISTDEEGGVVTRLAGMLGSLPAPRVMASHWTAAHLEQVMATRGRQMRALGIGMDTAPLYETASPATTPLYGGPRSFSSSPAVATAYANAFVEGLRAAGVLAAGKQFPGEGHANGNTDWAVAADPPLAALRKETLPMFEKGIEAKVPVIMIGHAVVPGLTGGQPASLSAATYTLLRRTMGFTGLAITDTLGARTVSVHESQPAAAVKAVEAGADMPMLHSATRPPALTALEHAVSTGALPLRVVHTRVAHVLVAKGVCSGNPKITP